MEELVMAVKKETEVITIPAIDIRTATITIKGDSPLIVHKWSEKAKKMMLDKQMKVATTKGHDAKDPFSDFVDTIYFLSGKPEHNTPEEFQKALENGAKFGFPAVGVKASAVSAGFRAGVTKNKVEMNGAFHALANSNALDGMASSTRLVSVRTWYDNALVAVQVVFAALTVLAAAMYVLNDRKSKKQ